MTTNAKMGVLAVVAAMLVAFGAFGLSGNVATADVDDGDVYLVDAYGIPADGTTADCADAEGAVELEEGDSILDVLVEGEVIICVNADEGDGDLGFDSNDVGEWQDPACDNFDADLIAAEYPDDACVSPESEGTDQMNIEDTENDLTLVMATFVCSDEFGIAEIVLSQDDDEFEFSVECLAPATDITLTAVPTTVEIVPARSNTSHSLITATAVDADGNPAAAGQEVRFSTNRCTIEESGVDTEDEFEAAEALVLALNTAAPGTYFLWEFSDAAITPSTAATDNSNLFTVDSADADLFANRTVAAAVLGCNPVDAKGVTPGVATVTAILEREGASDVVKTVDVIVIGPPAAVVVTAAPTSVDCGEKSTITVTVKDAIGQNVSDHTRVELISNQGSVLGGTGAVAGFAAPVTPIASTVGDTFGGVLTAFLLTSTAHVGPYEVLATTGGTSSTDGFSVFFDSELGAFVDDSIVATWLGGVFSTPPITAQVTVTCALGGAAPAPTITAPNTGQGITPPNTGDAGLVSTSGSSALLLALAGTAVAMVLAGLTLKVSRR